MSCDCSPRGAVSVDVCLGAGGRLSLRANGRAVSVGALKSALAARVGIPASKIVLLHRDRVLSDSGTLADHQVGDGCELRLLPHLAAGRDSRLASTISHPTTEKASQGEAESAILLDAVNSLPPEEIERFIQGQASLTVQQTMDDGRGLLVQFCLQPPQTAAAGLAERSERLCGGTSCTDTAACAALAAVMPPAAAVPTAHEAATCNRATGSCRHRANAACCGNSAAPSSVHSGSCCCNLERLPLRELLDQDGRQLCPTQQSNSCGCETVIDEMVRIGTRGNAVSGSFAGSVCMHRVGHQGHIDKKKQIILTILMDIMKASRSIKDRVELDRLHASDPPAQEIAVSRPPPASNDDEAMRKKVDHVRQQMAVRRHRHKCRTQFRMMPYS